MRLPGLAVLAALLAAPPVLAQDTVLLCNFDPGLTAILYLRALEISTPRHQVFDAVALQMDPRETGYPVTIQERAWSSPIWCTP
jgi:hypothetical protein